MKLAFEKVGRIDVWRVAVQPGKPFAFGTAERPDGGTALLFGLPGNPVSSFVTFELFVRPAIRALAGHPPDRLLRPVDRAVPARAGLEEPGPAWLRPGRRRTRADGSPDRDERGPGPGPPGRWPVGAGEPHDLGARGRGWSRGHPRGAGSFLRRSRLDELPQLWNVLKGDMSFVGPRPNGRSSSRSSRGRFRSTAGHVVRPGLTGWAQVRYTYGASEEDALQKLQYDLFYIKNLSVPLDLFIMLDTIKTVVLRKGPSEPRPAHRAPIVNAMSIDVEDYFHVSVFDGIVPRVEWARWKPRLREHRTAARHLRRIRGAEHVLRARLGRRAHPGPRAPHRRAATRWPRTATLHRLVYDQTRAAFRDDVRRAKRSRRRLRPPVTGYRAPSYSITPRSLWASTC